MSVRCILLFLAMEIICGVSSAVVDAALDDERGSDAWDVGGQGEGQKFTVHVQVSAS